MCKLDPWFLFICIFVVILVNLTLSWIELSYWWYCWFHNMLVILLDELDKFVSSDLSFGQVLVEIGVELQYAGFGSDWSWIELELDQTKFGLDRSWIGPKLGRTEVGLGWSWVGPKLDPTEFGSDRSWVGPKSGRTEDGSDQSWAGHKLGRTKVGRPILVSHFCHFWAAISGRTFLMMMWLQSEFNWEVWKCLLLVVMQWVWWHL